MKLNAAIHAIRRQAASLLLLAFVCAQLVELTHQNEHSGLDAAERCVTCVQLDSSNVAQAAPGPAAVADFPLLASRPARNELLTAETTYRAPARAPPES